MAVVALAMVEMAVVALAMVEGAAIRPPASSKSDHHSTLTHNNMHEAPEECIFCFDDCRM